MPAAPYPSDELERIKALVNLCVLDTAPEPEFDALVQAAALICKVPISLISLVDTDRQWFKANVGLPGAIETPREQAFCGYTILGAGIFEVEDATQDARFIDNPLVTADPKIRFYAGAPLQLNDGAAIGTLCVIDSKPNKLDDNQRLILSQLALAVTKALEGRRALKMEYDIHKEMSATALKLLSTEQRYRALAESSPLGVYSTDENGSCTYTNTRWQEIFGLSYEQSLQQGWLRAIHSDDAATVTALWQLNAGSGQEFDLEFRTLHLNGDIRFVHSRAKPIFDNNGGISGFVGSVQDVTVAKLLARDNSALLDTIRSQYLMSITNLQGVIVEANNAFCEISQLPCDQLIGSNHRIISSGIHTPEFFAQMWQTISAGNSWRGEICNRAADGSLYWVDSVITPLINADGNIDRYVSIRSDITQRKLQDEALRKNKAMLDRTGQIAGVGGWEVDLESAEIFWSDETCHIHGVPNGFRPTFAEAINFYAPEARPIIQAALENAMQTGASWDLELPFIQANGKHIWVRAAGTVEFVNAKPARITGVFQDITERIHQKLEIEEAHSRISLATDSGQIGVWEYDLTDGTLIWDDWMQKLYGVVSSDKIHTYDIWLNHVHADDRSKAEQEVYHALHHHKRFDTEFRIIRGDGQLRYIRGAANIQRDNSGNPVKLVGVNWDVTQLRVLAAELAEQHELLRVTLKSIGDAVITTDSAGNIVWLNPVAERMTGWTIDEAKGRLLTQVFHIVNEETRLKTENPVATCLEQGKIVGLANHTVLISRNGDEFGIEDSAAPFDHLAENY